MGKLPTDRLFEQIYYPKLLKRLEKRFGNFQQHHIELIITSPAMQELVQKMQQKTRRGEVVMLIPNEQGQLWLHTKAFYPQGIYRLMTVGLEPGEKPDDALRREVVEETGFIAKIERCLAVITYNFQAGKNALPFASYLFLTKPTRGLPQPTDPKEAIAHFKAIPVEALPDIAQRLRTITGDFADWGIFRAIAHDVAYRVLMINSI